MKPSYGRSRRGTRVIKKTNKYPFKRYNMLCAICADKVVGWKLYKDITGGLKTQNILDFYDEFIKDFLKDEPKRKVSTPINKKNGTTNFIETDVSYYDNDSKVEIYYFVGIVETANAYYKILCWGTLETKDTYKADFQKIFYSLKD